MKKLLLHPGGALRASSGGGQTVTRSDGPYRTPRGNQDGVGETGSDPMVGGLVILLVASLVRIVAPLLGREAFGAEPTLALFAAGLSGTQIALTTLAWWRRRAAHGRGSTAPDAPHRSDP